MSLASQIHQVLVFTNHGRACNLRGYPTLSFRDTGGRTVFTAEHTDDGTIPQRSGPPRAPVVHLRTGGQAWAILANFLIEDTEGGHCPSYTSAVIAPPGGRTAFAVPLLNPEMMSADPPRPAHQRWLCENRIGVVAAGPGPHFDNK